MIGRGAVTEKTVEISRKFAARFDCGVRFYIKVVLKDSDNAIISAFVKEQIIMESALRRKWHKVEHTFVDYYAGVRTVAFTMGGVDTQFWSGDYGPKYTLPCVRLQVKRP